MPPTLTRALTAGITGTLLALAGASAAHAHHTPPPTYVDPDAERTCYGAPELYIVSPLDINSHSRGTYVTRTCVVYTDDYTGDQVDRELRGADYTITHRVLDNGYSTNLDGFEESLERVAEERVSPTQKY